LGQGRLSDCGSGGGKSCDLYHKSLILVSSCESQIEKNANSTFFYPSRLVLYSDVLVRRGVGLDWNEKRAHSAVSQGQMMSLYYPDLSLSLSARGPPDFGLAN
jgi:hypothetical protein